MIRALLAVSVAAFALVIIDALSDGLPIFDGFTIIQTKTIQGTSK